MSTKPYILLGWQVSHFTGKLRGYLRLKRIPFSERPMNLLEYTVLAPRRGGAAAMPVLITPEGKWLQETRLVIDELERRFPEPSIRPSTPVQRFAAELFELWADEAWIPVSLHTRWSYRENYPRWEREAGSSLLPYAPRVLQDRLAVFASGTMRRHLGAMGIDDEQKPLLERWVRTLCDRLDTHFASHRYVLGGRASLADVGLYGTMFGHLSGDPWPRREIIEPRPHLHAWIERMTSPPGELGAFPEGDAIPATLEPIFTVIGRELLPLLEADLEGLRRHLVQHGAPRGAFPRTFGPASIPMLDGTYRRATLANQLWMAQRLIDQYGRQDARGRQAIEAWLDRYGMRRLLSLEIPRLKRAGMSAALA